jgi:hypothetical protein
LPNLVARGCDGWRSTGADHRPDLHLISQVGIAITAFGPPISAQLMRRPSMSRRRRTTTRPPMLRRCLHSFELVNSIGLSKKTCSPPGASSASCVRDAVLGDQVRPALHPAVSGVHVDDEVRPLAAARRRRRCCTRPGTRVRHVEVVGGLLGPPGVDRAFVVGMHPQDVKPRSERRPTALRIRRSSGDGLGAHTRSCSSSA